MENKTFIRHRGLTFAIGIKLFNKTHTDREDCKYQYWHNMPTGHCDWNGNQAIESIPKESLEREMNGDTTVSS